MIRILFFSLLLVANLLPVLAQPLEPQSIIYNVYDGNDGVIARVDIDPLTGALGQPSKLWGDQECFRMTTMRLTADRNTLFFMNELDESPLVGVVDLGDPHATVKLPLIDRPCQIQVHNNYAVASGHKGELYLISLAKQRILKSALPGKSMQPQAKRIVDFALTPDGRNLCAVYKYDSSGGGSVGGRIGVIETATLEVTADLTLPREHSELHFSSGGVNGPGPKWILLSPHSNTLVVGLELYGAVAMMDLDAALEGEIRALNILPTALDGSWGTAFPERGFVFQKSGRDFLWVTNASESGGCVIIDLEKRQQVAVVETGTRSLSAPVLMPDGMTLVAVSEGFQRFRGEKKIQREHKDGKVVVVMDLSVLASGTQQIPVVTHTLSDYIYAVAKIPQASDFVLLSRRNEKNKLSLATFDIRTGKVVDQCPSIGVTRTFLQIGAVK